MVFVLLLVLTTTTLAGGLTLTSLTERQIAAAHRRGVVLAYAADAAANRVLAGLTQTAEWATVPGSWTGGPVDVDDGVNARTAALNTELRARFPVGNDTPVWRPVSSVGGTVRSMVWVADDPNEIDGDPDADSNGVIVVRAEAVAALGARKAVMLWLERADAGVRCLAWREVD
jgi:hypothetical protein